MAIPDKLDRPGRPNLPALTGLRLILALFVLAVHQTFAGVTLGPVVLDGLPHLQSLLRTGYIAVGFFFLLSGFVLAYGYDLSQVWTKARLRRFFQARFARLYPVYILALVLTSPLAAVWMYRAHQHAPRSWAWLSPLLALPLLQSWYPPATPVWNGPGWSLSAELFFYLLFPLLGGLVWRLRQTRSLLTLIGAFWISGIVAPMLLAHHFAPILMSFHATDMPVPTFWSDFIRFDPLLHLGEFLSGVALAKLYLALPHRPESRLRSGHGAWFYLPAIAAELLLLTAANRIPYPVLQNSLLLPLHVLILLGLALGGPGLPRLLSSRPMVFLGQASYALYLVHNALSIAFQMVAKQVFHTQAVGWLAFLGYTGLCLATSSLIFACLEEPSRVWLTKRFHAGPAAQGPQRTAAAACAPPHDGLMSASHVRNIAANR